MADHRECIRGRIEPKQSVLLDCEHINTSIANNDKNRPSCMKGRPSPLTNDACLPCFRFLLCFEIFHSLYVCTFSQLSPKTEKHLQFVSSAKISDDLFSHRI